MPNFNKIILVGHVTRDPEMTYGNGGSLAIGRTTLAVNHKYKDKQESMFIDFVAFGKLAELLEQYVHKGDPLLIDGRLTQNRWEKDGQKRSKHEIVVDGFQLLKGKDGNKSGDSIDQGEGFGDDVPF
jgi:single-strand DNA-binding protein